MIHLRFEILPAHEQFSDEQEAVWNGAPRQVLFYPGNAPYVIVSQAETTPKCDGVVKEMRSNLLIDVFPRLDPLFK